MRKNKKSSFVLLLIILIGTLEIGFALLSQELTINGTSTLKNNTWNIYFDHLVPNSNNVTLSSGDVAATIDTSTNTDITYTVTLKTPGDFYEFTVDVINDGTIDAMVHTITNKLNNVDIDSTHPLPNYLNYSITYSDGKAIAQNHLLGKGETDSFKVRLEFKKDVSPNDLLSSSQTLTFTFGVEYIQADSNAVTRPVPTFADDSWEEIIANVRAGNSNFYHVGDKKAVQLGSSLGTHTLRIANTSTPAECSTEGFSQTACGFVLEFEDIIAVNSMKGGNTNVGGWPVTYMRTYLNSTIYNSLPSVIKNAIIDTTVVSGHGATSGETNFTSIDKLYLLSTHEVYRDDDGNTSFGIDYDDTAYHNTRQLDYYAVLNVTTSNYDGASKRRNGSVFYWWLRSAQFSNTHGYRRVANYGNCTGIDSGNNSGVSPAFRLG